MPPFEVLFGVKVLIMLLRLLITCETFELENIVDVRLPDADFARPFMLLSSSVR